MPTRKDWAIVDQEAQEEAAQDYLRLMTDVNEETTLGANIFPAQNR